MNDDGRVGPNKNGQTNPGAPRWVPGVWLYVSADDLSGNYRPLRSQKAGCQQNATLCIFACICKITHFWPNGIHTFCPDSDTPFDTQWLRIPAIHRCPNRIRRIRMRIRIRSTRCIAYLCPDGSLGRPPQPTRASVGHWQF